MKTSLFDNRRTRSYTNGRSSIIDTRHERRRRRWAGGRSERYQTPERVARKQGQILSAKDIQADLFYGRD